MDDLKRSMDRLFTRNHIDSDAERYQYVVEALYKIMEETPDKLDSIQLMLMDEGIKRIAGI